MLWNKARRSDNVNDTRKGKDARTLTGKTLSVGLAATALAAAGLYSTLDTPSGDIPLAPSNIATPSAAPLAIETAEDLQLKFVQSVLGETEDTWKQLFEQSGRRYPKPSLTLFEKYVDTGCGFASSVSGPFYCPSNLQVYLDLDYFTRLEQQFSVVGDFARAYIIAHEVGHHVQLVLGMSEPLEEALLDQQTVTGDGGLEVRGELQADCLAGVWAHHAQRRLDWLEAGDIEAALHAATVFGDDNLQRSKNAVVKPETFSHGTSQQRVNWFKTGFETGRTDTCDTFTAVDL
ncbi:KPN_02809 family neutral zinc metallopeptidase [Pseudomonas izuensis]|uniref:Neutral zinc metallopeptidase n=1 Tax=Pseudomonas izuensis TaxID=2684212 RepID=A0ABM7RZ95_9PSED|nr:neutral zinc metallopeptidase [Pseudomonas izuensis]BCX70641.1 neutral zinc metallopeptidase [Pseudomonas izuensis]